MVSYEKINQFFTEEELDILTRFDDYTRSIMIISRVYKDKYDKSGNKAWGHLLRVSNNLESLEEKIIGLLHDLMEDENGAYCTINDLRNLGYNDLIVETLELLNNDKTKFSSYHDYITNIIFSNNIYAIRTKIADMHDNLSPWRLNMLPEDLRARLKLKYETELPRLEVALLRLDIRQMKRGLSNDRYKAY